jgi:hypothetical protein
MAQIPVPNPGLRMKPGASEIHRTGGLQAAMLALATGALALPATAGAAQWDFTPRVAAGPDLDRQRGARPERPRGIRVDHRAAARLRAQHDGARARVILDYEAQALWFADNSDFNDVYHQLVGNSNFALVPDSLFLDAFARYDQQDVDIGGRTAFSNLFQTDNRTDFFVYGASPYHVGRWGSWGESLVRYQYQGLRYTNTDSGATALEDSDTNAISAELGSPAAARGFSWRASGSYTLTEFDEAREFEYARVALDVGVPVGYRTRATAQVGQESDIEEDPSAGGLDSTFWFVGILWEPSDLQSLEARVGERFFGTAYELHWRRRGSRGEVGLDYTEEPTTSSGVLGADGAFVPGSRPGIGTLDNRVFLQKRLAAFATYELVRSSIEGRIYTDRREFQDVGGGTESYYGVALSYDWDFAARTRLGATARWEQRDFQSDRRDDEGQFGVSVTRELSRTLSGVLSFDHYLRNSDGGDDYRANMVSLFVEAQF